MTKRAVQWCPGSGKPAVNVRILADYTQWGTCPACGRGPLSVTTTGSVTGNIWYHVRPLHQRIAAMLYGEDALPTRRVHEDVG